MEYNEDISSYIRKMVLRLGQVSAWDEKIFHFSGNSGDIRLVITMPDNTGLWYYELFASLSCGGSFTLWTKLHHEEEISALSVPVSGVVRSRVDVMKRLKRPGISLTINSSDLYPIGESSWESPVWYISLPSCIKNSNIFYGSLVQKFKNQETGQVWSTGRTRSQFSIISAVSPAFKRRWLFLMPLEYPKED